MRELKFRAWVKPHSIMLLASRVARYIPFISDALSFWRHIDASELKWSDLEVMQSTGLLDSKGKEIYEGDVLKRPECTSCESKNHNIVHWSDSFTGFKPFFCPDEEHTAEEFEVIGNIWEHPHLLEKK